MAQKITRVKWVALLVPHCVRSQSLYTHKAALRLPRSLLSPCLRGDYRGVKNLFHFKGHRLLCPFFFQISYLIPFSHVSPHSL